MTTLSRVRSDFTSGCEFTFTYKIVKFSKSLQLTRLGRVTARYKELVENVEIFSANRESSSGSENTFTKKHQEIFPKVAVDCHMNTRASVHRNSVQVSVRERKQHDHGATRPTSDFRRGAFLGSAPETLLDPVQAHHVVNDLLHKTLQDLVLGERTSKTSTETPQPPLAPPPHHPGTHFGAFACRAGRM